MHTTIDIKGDGGGGAVFFASVSKVSMTIDYRVPTRGGYVPFV